MRLPLPLPSLWNKAYIYTKPVSTGPAAREMLLGEGNEVGDPYDIHP